MKSLSRFSLCAAVALTMSAQQPLGWGMEVGSDLAVLKTNTPTGFANAGWKYDRYQELPSLDAGQRMVVADLQGPGIIRHIHTTRHQDPDLNARGIVLEITFDDAPEPAVVCPLADFFGDGCNGKSMDFSTPLIECAPWSYNCYFPMPFARRARVILHNDTPRDAMNYSYVEWEPLPQWKPELGYFHATWRRSSFQLTKDTKVTFFKTQGQGHLVGRQFSVVTDEPLFRDFNFVMEGNNEVDIDGRERALDYLGTEDSFTFSWGFQTPFAGLRAGMPFIGKGTPAMLSIYRFHDHLPIRFARELTWSINWSQERGFTSRPDWAARVEEDGCWMDYASVFYWYQADPAGYRHEPLPPLASRRVAMLHPNLDPTNLDQVMRSTPLDPRLANRFDRREDLDRCRIVGCYAGTHPFWIDVPEAKGGHPGNPNPGRRGILAVHAQSETVSCHIVRKVALPAETACELRLSVSGDPYEHPGKSDFLMAVGVHDGETLTWFATETINPGSQPADENWRTRTYALRAYAGKTVCLVVKAAYGGPLGICNEEAFFDEISVIAQPP
ncbi:MAG TPA: DUF2961 domain-containing protein [Candidatus Paceibacterota bacterium]|nr:DUF2961 domain-containing protein [Candidatus Paceibacterota bacterium]